MHTKINLLTTPNAFFFQVHNCHIKHKNVCQLVKDSQSYQSHLVKWMTLEKSQALYRCILVKVGCFHLVCILKQLKQY